MASLDGCSVKPVTKDAAKQIILTYEWLGTLPKIPAFQYGLFDPDDELIDEFVGPLDDVEVPVGDGVKGSGEDCDEFGIAGHWRSPLIARSRLRTDAVLYELPVGWGNR